MPPCGGHPHPREHPPRPARSFKSCPRVGGIKPYQEYIRERCGFKSCPRVGGIWIRMIYRSFSKSFKSCPRVGGITMQAYKEQRRQVSSRAPVWGASEPVTAFGCHTKFQVVPPCGGHHKYYMAISPLACFKSCPRVGGIRLLPLCGNLSGVSSRAPVWGASFALHIVERMAQGFKSCPRVGGIPSGRWMPNSVGGFKSCPRVGGIFAVECVFNTIVCFKSCPRVGGIALRSLQV